MNASTATATTATGNLPPVELAAAEPYVGRFAPSPTGSLHLGSLVAALGSYLDARHYGGKWLLRMEDLDTPRVVPGCADTILRTLEAFGLEWDGEVIWQSRNAQRYAEVLEELRRRGRTFECSCTRRQRSLDDEQGYPGTCRDKTPATGGPPTATRFRVEEDQTVRFEDRFQGPCSFDLRTLGDVVIRRRDGLFAYQLAVVVDDADAKVNYVVRGADLLASTAWQSSLHAALGLNQPVYAHLPVVVEPDGAKLSKSRRSVPLDGTRTASLLLTALTLLRQTLPEKNERLEFETPTALLKWGIRHWNPNAFHGIREVPAPDT